MSKQDADQSSGAQQGFTIIESVMAALFLFIVTLVVCQMFTIHSQIFLLNETLRSAEAQVEQVVDRLAAQRRDTLAAGEDQVILPAPGKDAQAMLPADCAAWPCAIARDAPLPDDTEVIFARRWVINSIDAPRNLVSVTVSVFDNTQSAEPLVRRTTNVVPQ